MQYILGTKGYIPAFTRGKAFVSVVNATSAVMMAFNAIMLMRDCRVEYG